VIQVAAGNYYSLALLDDGGVVAWGNNRNRQCDLPTSLEGKCVVQIATGAYHSLALLNDGTIVAWGSNKNGLCTAPALRPSGPEGPFLVPSSITKSANKT